MEPYNLNHVISGLGATTIIIPVASSLIFDGTLTLPNRSEGANGDSEVVVSITQNGANRLTTNPGTDGFRIHMFCQPLDEIIITLSSSAAADLLNKNTVKCTLAVG